MKRIDDSRIELRSAQRRISASAISSDISPAGRPVARHSVEGVGRRDDACLERDPLPLGRRERRDRRRVHGATERC